MKHVVSNYIINPTHQVTVDLIGAGGTGSQMLQSLARMDYALYKLGHPGLHVRVFDEDMVTEANIGRQLFSVNDCGLSKAEVLVTRVNRFYGLDWDSIPAMYPRSNHTDLANITISCVDSVKARLEVGKHIRTGKTTDDMKRVYYWMDFGNGKDFGQVVLGTPDKIRQPKDMKGAVEYLMCADEMFDLSSVDEAESGPSCSLAEALRKQDLFINSTLCQLGSALLWKLFTGIIDTQGCFLNLDTMKVNPIAIRVKS